MPQISLLSGTSFALLSSELPGKIDQFISNWIVAFLNRYHLYFTSTLDIKHTFIVHIPAVFSFFISATFLFSNKRTICKSFISYKQRAKEYWEINLWHNIWIDTEGNRTCWNMSGLHVYSQFHGSVKGLYLDRMIPSNKYI